MLKQSKKRRRASIHFQSRLFRPPVFKKPRSFSVGNWDHYAKQLQSSREAKVKAPGSNWNVGERYKILNSIGKGAYGEVCEATDLWTNQPVAIKRIPNVLDDPADSVKVVRELSFLVRFDHLNVNRLIDIITEDANNIIYLVMEHIDTDMQRLFRSNQFLTVPHIQVFMYQILCGLKYIHSSGVIHRDIKPANLLLKADCSLQICDFGLSRYVHKEKNKIEASKPRSASLSFDGTVEEVDDQNIPGNMSQHVITRWYRSPEVILLMKYGASVDVWSAGCVFAELLRMLKVIVPNPEERTPLFPGGTCCPISHPSGTACRKSKDQLNLIFSIIGSPTDSELEGSNEAVRNYLHALPHHERNKIAEIFAQAPPLAVDLLKRMLTFNPRDRITVDEALKHPFFDSVRQPDLEVLFLANNNAETIPQDMESLLTRELVIERLEQEITDFHFDLVNDTIGLPNINLDENFDSEDDSDDFGYEDDSVPLGCSGNDTEGTDEEEDNHDHEHAIHSLTSHNQEISQEINKMKARLSFHQQQRRIRSGSNRFSTSSTSSSLMNASNTPPKLTRTSMNRSLYRTGRYNNCNDDDDDDDEEDLDESMSLFDEHNVSIKNNNNNNNNNNNMSSNNNYNDNNCNSNNNTRCSIDESMNLFDEQNGSIIINKNNNNNTNTTTSLIDNQPFEDINHNTGRNSAIHYGIISNGSISNNNNINNINNSKVVANNVMNKDDVTTNTSTTTNNNDDNSNTIIEEDSFNSNSDYIQYAFGNSICGGFSYDETKNVDEEKIKRVFQTNHAHGYL